jgi:molybdopterin-guanine dinucleotide biosynthesis protein A
MPENEYSRHPAAPDVTAFVLTGGKSTRMGEDKALLRLPNGMTLLEHALATCGAVAGQVGIVGPRSRYFAYAWAGEIVEDIFPDRGPLAGIHAALTITQTDWNIMLAVDVPSASASLLRWLLSEARKTGKLITVPDVGGQQPLCAVYRKGFREIAESALQDNRNKINGSFPPADTRVIREQELAAAGFSPEMFANVNTPEDFAKFR